MTRKLLILTVICLAAAVAWRSLLLVDETETVIVTQFGDPVREIEAAGPYFKAPYQSTIRIDRRMQIYDPPPSEYLAKEKKNVNLDVFVCWRVETPRRFIETVGNPAGAEMRIHDVVFSELKAEIGKTELEALIAVDSTTHRLDEIMRGVTGRCSRTAKSAYGIKVVDVRLKRINLPTQIRESVFARMRAERARIAQQYRAEGEKEAMLIRNAADTIRATTLADADAEAQRTRGLAEAEATGIYTAAHRQDPEFYELVRSLDAYKKIFDEKTTVLLSADSDLLKYFSRVPIAAEPAENE